MKQYFLLWWLFFGQLCSSISFAETEYNHSDLYIRCGQMIDGYSAEPFYDQLISIRQGLISNVEPFNKGTSEDDKILNLSAYTLSLIHISEPTRPY